MHKVSRQLGLGLLLFAVVWVNPALANDSAVYNIGGIVKPMNEHHSIRLVAEQVRARVYRRYVDVECVFFLKNEGAETTVTLGFPDYSGGDVGGVGHFERFESFVDGDKVEVQRSDPEKGHLEQTVWWTKQVDFEAGETKVVADKYRGGLGFDGSHNKWFSYILYTGASWAGTIGSASIVVSFEDFDLSAVNRILPENHEIDGDEIRWVFHDFEPERFGNLSTVLVSWGRTPDTSIESDFHRAAANSDIALVTKMLDNGADIEALEDYSLSPLQTAIWFGAMPDMIELLLSRGADPSRYDDSGWGTPLHKAVWAAVYFKYPTSSQVITLLVEHGAGVNERVGGFENGLTALTIAKRDGASSDVVDALKSAGANE